MSNPWGITHRQAEVLDAVIEHDMEKVAAHHLGLSKRTVEDHMGRIKERMGLPLMTRHRHLLMWRDYRKGQL